MSRLKGFKAGVNLGLWLSQNGGNWSDAYLTSFITQDDIARVASWGMNHIRLPVDYPLIESDSNPGVYREEGYA